LLRRALTALGKSLLIVTGVGYGVVKALDVLGEESAHDSFAGNEPGERSSRPPSRETAPNPSEAATAAPADATLRRLDGMEERLIRMEKGLEILTAPWERAAPRTPGGAGDGFVTRDEMDAAMEQLASRLESGIERRFEVQNRSVQSLRTMVARTDELLERVIENIESASLTA
jgi:hypothetical protein